MTKFDSVSRFAFILWVFVLQLSTYAIVSAILVAAAILPHGDFAWDPNLVPADTSERHAANEIAQAARSAGAWLSSTINPDLILLSTPHGSSVSYDWVWYLASNASGYADIGLDVVPHATTYRVRTAIRLAPNVSQELLTYLKPQAVTGLLNFADSEDMPLRWGEVIPLLLLSAAANNSSSTSSKRPSFAILSHPLRRHTNAKEMVPELLQLGRSLRQWADASPLKVALLISADLSHRHLVSGPYGYSNTSEPMDKALGRWAQNPWHHSEDLLITAASMQREALACGFTGMVMLHGALVRDHPPQQQQLQDQAWNSKVWANRNVTYYGMMVATFEPDVQELGPASSNIKG